jgi:hypothetical protein
MIHNGMQTIARARQADAGPKLALHELSGEVGVTVI